MKYIKMFYEAQEPYSAYLIGNHIKSEPQVKNFINYYNISNSVYNVWKGMIQTYNAYPLKLDPSKLSYLTRDNCKLELNLENNEIVSMKKSKKDLVNRVLTDVVLYEGKYRWITFEQLFLGTLNENFDPETLRDGYYEHSEEAYIRRIPDTEIRNKLLMLYRKTSDRDGPFNGHYHSDNLEQALKQIAVWKNHPEIPWQEIVNKYNDNLLDKPV
jgi:hypothetical protein